MKVLAFSSTIKPGASLKAVNVTSHGLFMNVMKGLASLTDMQVRINGSHRIVTSQVDNQREYQNFLRFGWYQIQLMHLLLLMVLLNLMHLLVSNQDLHAEFFSGLLG